ncbi:MAG: large subunit ribosomal protein [Verrucomicrobiota bacterium]|jgi:large subunit ribosomal protein L4
MKIPVKDLQGKPQGEFEVKFELVEGGRGTQAVHDTVVAYRAAQRMGTACAKTVGEVSGSNKKPWRQKGTGRARAGSNQSPLWVGGGVVFGPRPRDFSKKVNNRTRQLALRKALTERLKAGDVQIVADLKLESPKTSGFLSLLKNLDVKGTMLFVDDAIDRNFSFAARNVSKVEIATADGLNTYQVLKPARLIITRSAFDKLNSRLAS